jgi:2-oxoisovalerate dehydrogenase E1 component alpha subunit
MPADSAPEFERSMTLDSAPSSSVSNLTPQQEDELLLRVYRAALTCRLVDERMWVMTRQGRAGFVLTPRGHEIAQVSVVAAMRVGLDSAWLYYRDMAAAVMLGVTPYELFLGCLGRADDPHSGGRQLSIHLSSPRLRIGSMSSAVAGHIPHAVGAAYAARVLGEESVAVCLFGDGASSEGVTHEAMNFAAIHKLPVVFVCENNGYAISVPTALQIAGGSVSGRACAYDMPGCRVDGTDARAVYFAAREAIDRARSGGGPSIVEAMVPRMTPHSSQDDDAYRTVEEHAAAEAADPLPRLRRELEVRGLLDAESDRWMRESIASEVESAEQQAFSRPEAEASRARQWLYAGDPPHPYLDELERQGRPTHAADD